MVEVVKLHIIFPCLPVSLLADAIHVPLPPQVRCSPAMLSLSYLVHSYTRVEPCDSYRYGRWPWLLELAPVLYGLACRVDSWVLHPVARMAAYSTGPHSKAVFFPFIFYYPFFFSYRV